MAILYVDIEHEKVLRDPKRKDAHLSSCQDIKARLEEIAGRPCLVQRFTEVTRQRLKELGATAMVISGNATVWTDYADDAFSEMHAIIREAEYPILGLCGGHQLIALAHGARVAPMRPLRPGEPDVTSLTGPGYLKEWGFTSVHVVHDDPLFYGLDGSPVFLEVHYWEVKEIPVGFHLLASGTLCPTQAMKQVDKPVYGTQFHPEGYTEGPDDRRSQLVKLVYPDGYALEQSDGLTLLANFFRIAASGHQPEPTVLC